MYGLRKVFVGFAHGWLCSSLTVREQDAGGVWPCCCTLSPCLVLSPASRQTHLWVKTPPVSMHLLRVVGLQVHV